MEKDAHVQIAALAGSLNQDLCSMVEQLQQALQEAMHGLQAMETRENEARKDLQDLNVKYDEDVGLLRMQMEEMGEAREVGHGYFVHDCTRFFFNDPGSSTSASGYLAQQLVYVLFDNPPCRRNSSETRFKYGS